MATLDSLDIEVKTTGNAADALTDLVGLVRELVSGIKELVGATRAGNTSLASMEQGTRQVAQATDQATESTKKQAGALEVLRDHWKAIAALGIGRMLMGQFQDLTNQAVSLQQLSNELGVTTRGLQALGFAAEQSNVSVETVNSGLRSLQDQVRSAAMGNSDAMQAFGFLGLSGRALQGMDAPARFAEVAEALAKIPDPVRRSGVAMKVFGGAATQMLPLLDQGAEGIERMVDEFAALGGGLSTKQIKDLNAWNAQLNKVNVTWLKFRGMIVSTILPVVRTLADGFQSVVGWLGKLDKNARVLEYGGIAVVIASFLKLISMLRAAQSIDLAKTLLNMRKWLGIAAIIGAVSLLIQDIYHAFEGGRSVMAEWFDRWKGLGAADRLIRNIKAGWQAMADMQFPGITDVIEAWDRMMNREEIKGRIEGITEAVNKLREQRKTATGTNARALDEVIQRNDLIRQQLENKLWGIDGIRAVGRGVHSDAQRMGELTTGSLSRNEGGVGSITIQNDIKVEQANGSSARETGQATARAVDEKMREAARQLQTISRGKR